ncbi:cell wall protein [Tenggerimyces flavus]|uniref:Cell wall protein n=1 Tax=Tenggerimyces flavus TaxID=1708749 RepID=A0ABV7Y3E5_9ACTN|nr:cell wall protein [Tenggerimyces flavus]MBM7790840.1 hypothetical protein [Tenggerimyces flavus]
MTTANIDRRKFLTSAAVGGATIVGASALGGLDADAAFADPTPSLDPAISKSSFAEGVVRQVKGSQVHVKGSYDKDYVLQLTNATSIWKSRPTTAAAILDGDGLYARGIPMPDGTIAVDAVWVNIVNLYCTIKGIGTDKIDLAHGHHALVGRVTKGITTASYLHGGAITANLSGLKIDQPVQVLGTWRPADNSVEIVRISVGHH